MSYLKSLPHNAVLLDLFRQFPKMARPLLQYHEELLRGPSPFSIAERELIAAYVSGLNECDYCHGVHTATAERFGVPERLLKELMQDVESAGVDEKMKPVLAYVKKLTLTPNRMTQADAGSVFDAGWDDVALHDTVSVCALFNFMNRLVEGLGIQADADYFRLSSKRLAKHGYAYLAEGANQ